MQISVPRETDPHERRVAMVPDAADKLVKAGLTVCIEAGAGLRAGYPDEAYAAAGAALATDRTTALSSADIVCRVGRPCVGEIEALKPGCLHVSYLDPFNERSLVTALARAKISAVSMEMIPRTTRAQKMDALSSQASLAGYVMVLLAATRLDSILPMMMTPSGTISPARVFVIGAGVAGLQAIATAKRLGARVDAFDVRPVVAEQVQSLGARFVKIDLGEIEQTKDGYAKPLTPEQIARQQEGMAAVISQSDIVITTAQVFGRPTPRIVTRAMIESMRPGGVVVDMAAATGGNVEGSIPDQEVVINGVTIIGVSNLPSQVAKNASQMYANNLTNFVLEYWDKESGRMQLDLTDEILARCLITHDGEVVNEVIRALD